MTAVELTSYVAGEWRPGAETIEDRNPARASEVVAEVRAADAALAEDAAAAAGEAFAGWRDTPPPARGEILRRAADMLERRAQEVGRDLAREEGKTAAEAVGETARAVAILRYYAGQTLEPDGETYPSHSASTFLYARREPVGPVAAITPWNFPIAIPTRDLGRALRFAREARAGVVKVNQETAGLELEAPFGGTKQSSSGSREQGKVARDFFTEWKTVYVDPPDDGAA